MPHSWEEEVLKAQAVVSRTYAVYQRSRNEGRDYDVSAGTRHQVYPGVAGETPRIVSATGATRGEILTHDGQVILAAFHSASGGHTASSAEVWGEALPYLPGPSAADRGGFALRLLAGGDLRPQTGARTRPSGSLRRSRAGRARAGAICQRARPPGPGRRDARGRKPLRARASPGDGGDRDPQHPLRGARGRGRLHLCGLGPRSRGRHEPVGGASHGESGSQLPGDPGGLLSRHRAAPARAPREGARADARARR